MTAAIVNLLDGWTILAVLAGCSLVYVGHLLSYGRAYDRGWLAGRAALRREQAEAGMRVEVPPVTIRAVHAPHLTSVRPGRPLFDQEETGA